MPHPLVEQLRFARSEFVRGLAGVSEEEAQRRFLPMNSLGWNVGHLAWQEQRYFVTFAQGKLLQPKLNHLFANGAPACTPTLAEMWAAWHEITAAADEWLNAATTATLLDLYTSPSKRWITNYGNLIQRTIYHYWFHNGENLAIRQNLGHADLPQFVGELDTEAPFRLAED